MGDHLLSELSILRYRDCHVHLPCRVLAHSSPTLKPKLARSSPRATTVKPKLARSSPKTVKPEMAPSPKGVRRSFNSPTLESSLARIGNMINIMDVDLLSDTVGGSYGRQERWLHSPLIIAPTWPNRITSLAVALVSPDAECNTAASCVSMAPY